MEIKDLLIVKDNFFQKNIFEKIKKDLMKLNFTNYYQEIGDSPSARFQKPYFNANVKTEDVSVKNVISSLNKYNFNIKNIESHYFLSGKHIKDTVHNDPNELNCLIYLKGNSSINNGTGFYDYVNGEYVLNRHIGFKENRAIIFDAKIFHASLQFIGEDVSPRYIMVNWINLI